MAITNAQKDLTKNLQPGETAAVDFPVPEGIHIPRLIERLLPMWRVTLKQVESQIAKYGFDMQSPATDENIDQLKKGAKTKLQLDLPEAFLDFLKLRNGLNWNGVFIYGSKTLPIANTGDEILGLIEANEIWRDCEGHKEMLFFGDGNISLYGVNLETGKFNEIDRSSNTIINTYDDFENLLNDILKASLI